MGKNPRNWEEVAAFLETAEMQGLRDHALACLVELHGLSLEAVCQASVADLVSTGIHRVLLVRVIDGSRPMHVPLAVRTVRALDEYIGPRSDGSLLLDNRGHPLHPRQALRIVKEIARAAGLGHRLAEPA